MLVGGFVDVTYDLVLIDGVVFNVLVVGVQKLLPLLSHFECLDLGIMRFDDVFSVY